MQKSNHIYYHNDIELNGYVAYKDFDDKPKPAVIIIHDWSGRNEFAMEKAIKFANYDYVGFALDMFGKGKVASSVEEKQALITPFLEDRKLLLERVISGVETLKSLEFVDQNKIAVIGFCFGGLCALDFARSGADIAGVISVHGLFNPVPTNNAEKIIAKVLALHGYDDPMVLPDMLDAFCKEMTKAQADWQVHVFGNTQHAFTNPQAHDSNLGTVYNKLAATRSWVLIDNFIEEIFS